MTSEILNEYYEYFRDGGIPEMFSQLAIAKDMKQEYAYLSYETAAAMLLLISELIEMRTVKVN